MLKIKIKSNGNDTYVAVNEITRVAQLEYYGGSVVVLKDGARIETYESVTDLHERIVAEEERLAQLGRIGPIGV